MPDEFRVRGTDGVYRTDVPVAVIRALCPVHRAHAFDWRNNAYNVHRPSEWPGGGMLMDNRTLHAARRADWEAKNQAQILIIVGICRSGRSPQCIPEGCNTS